MFAEILFNLAALIAFCVISTFLMEQWPTTRSTSLWIQGVLFGLIAVAGMSFPVELSNGFILDGRTVVLSLAAWHFGWRASLVSALIAAGWRVSLGGPGAVPGVMTVMASSSIGLGFRRWVNPEKETVNFAHATLLGFGVNLCSLLIIEFYIEGISEPSEIILPMLTAFPLATVLASRILGDYQARSQAETRVARSEDLIQNIFEDSPLSVLVLDPETNTILDANDTAVELYGYPKQTLTTLSLSDLQVKEPIGFGDRSRIFSSIPSNFKRYHHRLASGEIRVIDQCRGEAHFAGRDVELMFVTDITDQLQYVQQTQDSLREKEDILGTAMDGFWVLDDQGNILEVNSAYCSLSGYLPEELVGQHLSMFDCLQEHHAAYLHNGQQEGANRFETQHRTKDGQRVDLDVNVSKSASRDDLRHYVFFRDVSEQKAAEKRMRLLSACLSVAENTVVISDAEQRIDWVNDAFCRISGYRKDEAYGKTTAEIFQPEVESPEASRSLERARLNGVPWRGELTNLKKDGTPFTVDATLTPLKNEQGAVTHYIGILQDISEKKELERLFLRAQRLESLGSLTSGIAHDLNNILSPIMMSAELLRASVSKEENRRMADVIMKSAERGGDLLKQLLGFARGSTAEKQTLPPGPLIKETFKMYQETFPKNIKMQLDLDPDLPSVSIEPSNVAQVIGNLMINAKDAMPKGGTLTLKASREHLEEKEPTARMGSFVRIQVADTGTGIGPENIDMVFEPFFTTKPEGKGTGLGLATCMNIVNSHGGFMEVHSEEGHGTKMEVFLPVSEESTTHRKASEPERETSPPGSGQHILVADDELAVRTLVSTALKAMAYEVDTCANGREVFQHLEADPELKLLLLDLEMPEMNGLEVLKELEKRNLSIPVLMITGTRDDEGNHQTALQGKPVLYKPFTLDELRNQVEHQLKPVSS
jgi:PAS domain S-box-containing protein